MAEYLLYNLPIHIIIFQFILLVIATSNILLTHLVRRNISPRIFPFVSILVPARNEELSIRSCVTSLLEQDYPNFEVLVLDDQSSDKTNSILLELRETHSELIILQGLPPKDNQTGKNWACNQLAQHAKGELFFFTDADTIHKPGTLHALVTTILSEEAELITGYPRQEVVSWGERFLVPFFSWAMLCFNPLLLAYKLQLPAMASGVGQVMLFKKQAYLAIGGHDKASSSIVDDLILVRRISKSGMRWRVAFVADLVSCRMYRQSKEATKGFRKNFFAAFDYRLIPFLFVFIWLAVMFWEPLLILILMKLGIITSTQPWLPIIAVGFSILLWIIPSIDMRSPILISFLYPITILFVEVVAVQSLLQNLLGKDYEWKDRTIKRTKWKWF